ncbi:PREDICTED: putative F-box/kelch-repeat protein At4g11750 [Camelina sativa]|uniref:F-box/kelch-repeat protein At4g11750 n=1 Tax=Camelina sativa TaxID=90675 RepID=A0ABM0WBL5_CAMSA|nr:PREDICTED: putative F-box/kelch-repeat protein At4g11750 [Camelina sativa]
MTNSPIDLPYLPDELLLHCLACVSRCYYPTLSLVSKRFCSLVASLELYKARTLLGRTEKCLYVCLRLSSETRPRWFTLCRNPTLTPNRSPNPNPKPNPDLNLRWFPSYNGPQRILANHTINEEKKLSDNHELVSVPTCIYYPPFGWPRAASGSNIYIIGGYFDASYSTKLVFFMDCRSHTSHKAPSTQMARNRPLVNVIDGKIYVVKGCKNPDSSNMIEFFDPKTQIWEYLPCPIADIHKSHELRSLAINGKLYLFGNKRVVYDPKENRWDVGSLDDRLHLASYYSSCVIDNVIYYYHAYIRRIWWYDPERRLGGLLLGLAKLPKLPTQVRMVDYGGKIMILWEKEVVPATKVIYCAEIALERRNTEDMYGKIEWRDIVLKLSKPYDILEVITATV